ncbi:MAG: septation protein SpoVG family protein [Planctomycetaceae bacterium]
MEITEVRIKLMDDPQERLQAFCSITFDHCFVIRDLKIIEGTRGSFVAMPSRKLTDRCPRCGTKNQLRACFCSQCGARLKEDRASRDTDGRSRLYADIAHPINARCREQIQVKVMQAFAEEQVKATLPGYICTYDDYGEDGFAVLDDSELLTPVVERDFQGRTLRLDTPAGVPVGPAAQTLSGPHFGLGIAGESRGGNDWHAAAAERKGDGVSEEGFGTGVM